MCDGLLGGRAAERRFARLKPGLDRFRNVACAGIMIAEHSGPAALLDGGVLEQPRCDPRMKLALLLVEQGGVGDFLYHRVLEREDRALRLLAAIHNACRLERPQRVFQGLAFTREYAEDALIV